MEQEIERTLRYFEFFKHALYIEELHIFLRVKTSLVDLENAIKPLLDSTIVFYSEGLYALHPDHIQLRKDCKKLNLGRMKTARRVGKFIQSFPYLFPCPVFYRHTTITVHSALLTTVACYSAVTAVTAAPSNTVLSIYGPTPYATRQHTHTHKRA